MKKILKSGDTPDLLRAFQQDHPSASWDQFKAEARQAYEQICATLESDQCGLCAYCEIAASKDLYTLQVEHVVAKSYRDSSCNWALHWPNMLAVCQGGAQWARDNQRYLEPLPANMSCDQHKNHLVNAGSLNDDSRGFVINPLELPAFPALVVVLNDGSLIPNPTACDAVVISPNRHPTTLDLISKSIEVLNLNCYRLCQARMRASNLINRDLRQASPAAICPKYLGQRDGHRRQFFTVYRCRLGRAAETYLAAAIFGS